MKLSLGIAMALDAEVMHEGDGLTLARVIGDLGDIDVAVGKGFIN